MSIIVIRNGVASRVAATGFVLEEEMQAQIAANPGILPLHEIRENAELVAVVREFPVSSGSIDLLGFDADGEIYIIETKLLRNPDRRTVIAQALDYGAALWIGYPDADVFVAKVNELRARAGKSSLSESLVAANGGEEQAIDAMIEGVARNLRNGSFRFVVPMDRMPDGLKDLIRYLNENSRFTLYLVELDQYQDGDLTVVVPRLFGAESRKSVDDGGANSRQPSSEKEFMDDLEAGVAGGELEASAADAVRALLRLVTERGESNNWKRVSAGHVNVSPHFPSAGAIRSPFTLRSDGRLTFNFGYVDGVAWEEWKRSIRGELGILDDGRKFPELRPEKWVPHTERILQLTAAILR